MTKMKLAKITAAIIAAGAVLGIAFFFVLKTNVLTFFPTQTNQVVAEHDELSPSEQAKSHTDENGRADASEYNVGDVIGSVTAGGTQYVLKYNSDYTNLASGYSFISPQSSLFGETGCVYLKAINKNTLELSSKDEITVSSVLSQSAEKTEFVYKYADDFIADSEYEALQTAPRADKSLIIYYEIADGVGFSGKYAVYVYKEAE